LHHSCQVTGKYVNRSVIEPSTHRVISTLKSDLSEKGPRSLLKKFITNYSKSTDSVEIKPQQKKRLESLFSLTYTVELV